MVRYSFLVRLSHPLLHAGLSRRLLNHLVGPVQQRLRNRHADLLGRLEIDNQLELRRLLHWQCSWISSLQDFVHVISHAPVTIGVVRRVGSFWADSQLLIRRLIHNVGFSRHTEQRELRPAATG